METNRIIQFPSLLWYIPLSVTNKMQRYTVLFITVNALHVSEGFFAHHQELKTVHTESVICQACLLLAWVRWHCQLLYGDLWWLMVTYLTTRNMNSFKFVLKTSWYLLWHVFGRSSAVKCACVRVYTSLTPITFVSRECQSLPVVMTQGAVGWWWRMWQVTEKNNLTSERRSNMRIKKNVYHRSS
jgi:hypothetical protein